MEALLSRAAGILFLGKVSVVTGGDQIDLYGDARLRVISYAKNRYLVVMQAWKGRPEEKDWHSLEFRLLSFDLLLDAIRAGGGSVGRGSTVLTQKLQAVDAMRQGRLGVAADNITAALASAPEDAQALKISGMLYGAANKHDLALKAFNAVLERWPDDAEAHFYIAQIYSTQRRYQEAATILQKFVNVQPTDIESYLTIGRASCRLGKTSEGLSAIANARELNP
jgi:tetratricopeptide (TPR) repeat protein